MKTIRQIKMVLAILTVALFASMPVVAATVTTSPTVAATNNILATAGGITSIVLSGTTNTVKVQLFDASTNTLTYVIGAYTNYVGNVFTNTVTYTDILGASVTNSYRFLTNVASTVAQSTNTFATLGAFSIPSGETVTVNYDNANPFFRGILVTNSAQVNVTVNYVQWK
jgi:hypothetical protein